MKTKSEIQKRIERLRQYLNNIPENLREYDKVKAKISILEWVLE